MENNIEGLEIKMVNESAAMCIFPDKQCFQIYTLEGKLSPRKIRIIQLAIILKGSIINSFETAEMELSILNELNCEVVGKIIKEFKVYDFSDENPITGLSNETIEMLKNNMPDYQEAKEENIKRFFSCKFIALDKNVELKTLKQIGIYKHETLKRFGIITVEDLLKKSEKDLLNNRGIGEAAIQNIKEKLKEVGLELKQ